MINGDYAGETTYGNTQLKIIPAYHKSMFNDKMIFSTGVDVILDFMSAGSDLKPACYYDGTCPDYELADSKDFYADLDFGINLGFFVQ